VNNICVSMRFILGQKIGMTQIFRDNGDVVPVTRVKAGPCVVTQIKKVSKDSIDAVQIGFGDQKVFRLNKASQGHLKGLPTVRFMRDGRVEDGHTLKRGDMFTVTIFTAGEKVQVTGTSKGKGFQGVVKRHGFHGSPATHGHKDQLRMPGSIGSTGPQRVFKGTRMAGHMGDEQVTVKNLEIVQVDADNNELFIKGAVPGSRNGLLVITTNSGKIEIQMPNEESVVESTSASEVPVISGAENDNHDETVETVEPKTEESSV